MSDSAPDKFRLIPDQWHIHNVGSLRDRRLFLVDSQLEFASGVTRDFVCTFILDEDGHLVGHLIKLVGDRGAYPWENGGRLISRHLAALGDRALGEIWCDLSEYKATGLCSGLSHVASKMANGASNSCLATPYPFIHHGMLASTARRSGLGHEREFSVPPAQVRSTPDKRRFRCGAEDAGSVPKPAVQTISDRCSMYLRSLLA